MKFLSGSNIPEEEETNQGLIKNPIYDRISVKKDDIPDFNFTKSFTSIKVEELIEEVKVFISLSLDNDFSF